MSKLESVSTVGDDLDDGLEYNVEFSSGKRSIQIQSLKMIIMHLMKNQRRPKPNLKQIMARREKQRHPSCKKKRK